MGVGGSWWELVGVGGSWRELVGVGGSWWELRRETETPRGTITNGVYVLCNFSNIFNSPSRSLRKYFVLSVCLLVYVYNLERTLYLVYVY